jgi:L-rhamnose mutarotase
MRVALHSILRSGQEAAYDQAHARIRPDLVASLQRVGIHDWAIWRTGRDLFHLVDCEDFDAAMSALADDPVNQRWQVEMAHYVERFDQEADTEDLLALPLVWTLVTQLNND